MAVGFGSGRWGALASFGVKRFAGREKRYGASGNRFVAMVEFGETPRAKSLLAGGQSGDPRSPHCFDQARLSTEGRFKDVAYYREGVLAHAQSIYQPGAESATDPEAGYVKQQGLQSD
ncbi:penicillin acylase family protein [Pseudomonadales bacterium]|nr:penicillin acylase family protein [Pseudomonadales bacterium]